MSERLALLVEYRGGSFHGSQYQAGVRTVQSELERALSVYLRRAQKVVFAGRTDSGVHARGQVVHFDTDEFDGDFARLLSGLNGILPRDVSIAAAQPVPDDFHARFSASEREYVYRILNRGQRSALFYETHYFAPIKLDIDEMMAATRYLAGVHDFSSFKSSNSDTNSTTCKVMRAELLNLGEGQLEFWIAANHFVYNMVRIIVGTLMEIGLGKKAPEGLLEALTGSDRDLAGPTAPPWGLTLHSVRYPEVYGLFKESSLWLRSEK